MRFSSKNVRYTPGNMTLRKNKNGRKTFLLSCLHSILKMEDVKLVQKMLDMGFLNPVVTCPGCYGNVHLAPGPPVQVQQVQTRHLRAYGLRFQ